MERLTLEEYRDSCWLKVEQYVEGIKDESIVVGDYIKKAVNKYIRMLNEKDKYTYRTDRVDKLFSFFSFLNVQHKNQYILIGKGLCIIFAPIAIVITCRVFWLFTDR